MFVSTEAEIFWYLSIRQYRRGNHKGLPLHDTTVRRGNPT